MRAAAAAGVLAAFCPCALALNPALDVSQYAHTSWTIRDGFFDSTIQTIGQTPDGYLWLGTEFGLFRFDGVRKVAWNPPAGSSLPNANVKRLLVTRDGRLWIGTRTGLASWKDGRFVRYPELAEQLVASLAEDREGTVWAGTWGSVSGRLCAIRDDGVQCYGQNGGLGIGVLSLFEENGNLWAGAGNGLWRWRPDPPKHYADPEPRPELRDLITSDDGRLLIARPPGLTQLAGERLEPFPIRTSARPASVRRLLRDQNGSLWIGTSDQGLLHVHQGRTDRFDQSNGLSGDYVSALFEDREGDIWAATSEGLDRFRDLAVPTMSSKQGLASDQVGALLAASDGSVWIGGIGGLSRWKNGQITVYRKRDGLPDDSPISLSEDSGGRIWVATKRGLAYWEDGRFVPLLSVPIQPFGLTAEASEGSLWATDASGLVHLAGKEVVERVPLPAMGYKDNAITLAGDAKRGGIWLGFLHGGLVFVRNGGIRESYTTAEGLGAGMITGLYPQPDGSVWVATEGGLSRIKDGHVATLNSRNGLPCDSVRAALEDDDDAEWIYLACGLVRISRNELAAWTADPKRPVKSTFFDASDGAAKQIAGGNNPKVAKLKGGQLWFATARGVSIVDPHHLAENKIAPPVHIESITVDDKPYEIKPGMRLPPNPHNVTIDYTALSLAAPEKVHFKYRLEGQDPGWREVVNDREVQYSNLRPKKYRFHVIASNNSGLWNETGDTLEFSIAPAWNQTTWFYASCVAAFLGVLWGLYRLRLYQIRREFNAQLDGRVDERLRVARELHDTLLQSFQASLIQMQAARNVLARRPEKAGQSLDKAITTAAGAVAEGRDAIQNLRLHPAGRDDFAQLLTAAGQELTHSEEAQGNPPVFRLTVEGERRDLEPLLQDEVYRIARELLRNAFRHAQAGRIEAEIRYESRQLRVHIRDDGKGIDPEVLKAGGRAGHWGMPGMRERVERFGGKLDFWSEAGAGTEAVLTVPAAAAYGASNGGAFSFLRRKKAPS
ncbi:MAG TPA: two-component regulator propeller domain-containing protein [Bryobacteraceae bacterium]|nr:two-component regulator propeller domain-containing protein [Bryobacteraceae bacterium]